jgi:hypothetical protein
LSAIWHALHVVVLDAGGGDAGGSRFYRLRLGSTPSVAFRSVVGTNGEVEMEVAF